jgi:hypothetical protein
LVEEHVPPFWQRDCRAVPLSREILYVRSVRHDDTSVSEALNSLFYAAASVVVASAECSVEGVFYLECTSEDTRCLLCARSVARNDAHVPSREVGPHALRCCSEVDDCLPCEFFAATGTVVELL